MHISQTIKVLTSLLLFLYHVDGVEFNDILPDRYPEVYDQVEWLPFNSQGWYPHGPVFEKLVKENQVANIVEVGSWLGCSTRHFAQLIPDGGHVFAVDHWKGSEEHFTMEEVFVLIPFLYQQFLSNVVHANLTHKIVPVRMDSLSAADRIKHLDLLIDLVYIDAAHDYESVYQDLCAWYPYVKEKGILTGDDWNIGDVRRAVVRFAEENQLIIYTEGGFWMYAKK